MLSSFIPQVLAGVLVLGFFAGVVNAGYAIDNDCEGSRRDFIIQGMNNAKQLIRAGIDTVKKRDNDKLLYNYLYGPDDPYVRGQVTNTLNNLLAQTEMLPDGATLGRSDVKFYCTSNRYQKSSRFSSKIFDPDIQERVDHFATCSTAPVFAYTFEPRNTATFNQIQLCPWFLDYAMGRDPQYQGTFTPGFLAKTAAALDTAVTKLLYSDIDLISLFDKVLVHELSHTKGAGSLQDVGGIGGYGWKNCVKLSTNREGNNNGPEVNADSIALFCSGSFLLQDGVTEITSDGKVKAEPAAN